MLQEVNVVMVEPLPTKDVAVTIPVAFKPGAVNANPDETVSPKGKLTAIPVVTGAMLSTLN